MVLNDFELDDAVFDQNLRLAWVLVNQITEV